MALERTSGNGNFDHMEMERIRMMASVMERGAPSQNFNAQDEALINDITDMIDELQSNMNAGAGNELESMISRIAGRLMVPGLSSAASNAIMLEVERRDGKDGRVFSAEEWNKIKEDVEKEKKKQEAVDDVADKVQNSQQQEQQQRQERAEAWANSDHTYAGQRMSADEWLRMIQWFKQPENRKAWEDAMMTETGQSREKVQKIGEKMDRLDSLIEKESRGEKLTSQEEAEKLRLSKDADVIAGYEKRREQQENMLGLNIEKANDGRQMEGSGPIVEKEDLFGDTAEYQELNNDKDVRAGIDERVTQQSDNYQISTNLSGASADAGRLATSPSRDVQGGIQTKTGALTGNFNIQSGATPVNAPVSTANEPSVQLAQSTVAPPSILPVRTNMI